MRGRPAATAIDMRRASLTTAVCPILRANSTLTNERTCQEGKLFDLFVTRSLVKEGPHSVHFVDQPLLYLRIAQYMKGTYRERRPGGVRSCCK